MLDNYIIHKKWRMFQLGTKTLHNIQIFGPLCALWTAATWSSSEERAPPVPPSSPMVLFNNLGVRYIRNPARFCRLDSCQNLGHWGGLIIIKALFPDFHRSPLGT